MRRTVFHAIFCALIHSIAAPCGWGAEVPFDPADTIFTGSGSSAPSVVTVDLDGDGDLDLVSSPFGNRIAWFENTDGAGTFGGPNVISTAVDDCREVHAADLDGDGDPDVLSASSDDDTIAWYENRLGDGVNDDFNPIQQVISTAADSAQSVHAADLDGDGDLDVVSASALDDTIAWYENRLGDGVNNDFNPIRQVISTAADGASSVRAVDMDRDGDPDVVSASRFDDTIAWYENRLNDGVNNDFNPSQQVIATTADFADSVSTADLDGDGDVDVLSASQNDDTIAWYENTTGTGVFSAEKVLDASLDRAQWVTTGDVDGDGDQDVVASGFTDARIALYENLSIHRSAHFPEQSIISTVADHPVDIIAADVDGDGDLDAVAACSGDDLIAWYENVGGSPVAFTPHSISSAALGAQSVAVADMDRDGDLDVLSASELDDTIAWYANNGLAVFGAPQAISTTADGASSVCAADVDGDGDVDVLSASRLDGEIVWYESDGAYPPAFSAHLISSLAAGALGVVAVDLDRDGDLDGVSVSEGDAGGGGALAWYENTDGAGTFGGQQVISTTDGLSAVFATDLDGDGDVDLLSSSSADNTISWHENDGAQNFLERTISTTAAGASSVFAFDLDRDGDVDVLSASRFDDTVAWYESDGGSPPTFTEHIITRDPDGAGLSQGDADQAETVFVADVDSDGDPDVLSASSLDDKLAWYENLGGQAAFSVTDRAQMVFLNAQVEDLFSVELLHRGRAGDSDLELACVRVRFEEIQGTDLTAPQANGLFDELRLYLDDGSGSFESGADSLVTTLGTFIGGIETLIPADGDPDVQVSFGTTKKFFVVLQMAANATSQTPDHFVATQLVLDCPNAAEDSPHDIALTVEHADDVSTGRIDTSIYTSSCSAPFDLNLTNATLNTGVICQAGTIIRAGNAFVVAAPGGDLTCQAGEAVHLMNGFEVEAGAALTAQIDPGLLPP